MPAKIKKFREIFYNKTPEREKQLKSKKSLKAIAEAVISSRKSGNRRNGLRMHRQGSSSNNVSPDKAPNIAQIPELSFKSSRCLKPLSPIRR